MTLKKEGILFFAIIFIIFLSLITFVYSEENQVENSQDNKIASNLDFGSIWDKITSTTSKNWDKITNYTSDKFNFAYDNFLRLIGVRSFEGEGNVLWSSDFWKSTFWYYLFTFSLFTFLFLFLFTFIYIKSMDTSPMGGTWVTFQAFTLPYNIFVIIILILYPFLMGIPLLNRFLQIITLEFLGVHWIWRSFIFASILFFSPKLWKEYLKYIRRKRTYKAKLEKVAGEEVSKAMARA